jgi:hypothetical protein
VTAADPAVEPCARFDQILTADYPGRCEDVVGQRVGPSLLGEFFTAGAAYYDPNTDLTTVWFDLVVPDRKAA